MIEKYLPGPWLSKKALYTAAGASALGVSLLIGFKGILTFMVYGYFFGYVYARQKMELGPSTRKGADVAGLGLAGLAILAGDLATFWIPAAGLSYYSYKDFTLPQPVPQVETKPRPMINITPGKMPEMKERNR